MVRGQKRWAEAGAWARQGETAHLVESGVLEVVALRAATIVFAERGQVVLREEEVASPGPGQVLVRARASLVSTGTECIVLTGDHDPGTGWAAWGRFPFRPGYSMVGEVVDAGPGCRLRPGDRVAARQCHQQYFLGGDGLLRVPTDISDQDASWFAIASIVQNGIRRIGIGLGDTVVVIGAGILGQLALQYARICGARDVVAVDVAAPRLALAQRAGGATHTLGLPVAAAVEPLRELTGGRLADVVIDATGAAAVLDPAFELCRRLGRLLILGDTGHPAAQHLSHAVMLRGITITAAHDSHPPAEGNDHYRWSHREMQELFFALLRQDRMRVTPLISEVVSPRQAPEVYLELLEHRDRHMGVVFDWTAGAL